MALTILSRPAAAANQPSPAFKRVPVGIMDHHMGGYLPGTTSMFQNPSTGYATNYGIGTNGGKLEIHQYVPAEYAAWGNGNGDMNNRAISIEHENDRSKYPDVGAKPTAAVHELSAQFHAEMAVKFNMRIDGKLQLVYAELSDYPVIGPHYYNKSIPGFGREFNVIPHRAVAKKDCPRHLDVKWIVNRANQIIQEGVAPKPTPSVIVLEETTDMRIVNIKDGGIVLVGPKAQTPIYTPTDVQLLVNFFAAKNTLDTRSTFTDAEIRTILGYTALVN